MKSLLKYSFVLIFVITAMTANAADINFSGKYRLESQLIKNPNLGSDAREYSYIGHHLVLSPNIVAADGVTIHTRFDIFNNGDFNNSQLGDFFGGSAESTADTASTGDFDTGGTVRVSELYLSWANAFGSLIAGRAPVQFGLGLTHNAGNGEFDHWFDRKDLIGYKFILGNMFFLPMYGKVKEGGVEEDDDIRDYMLQFGYENYDTDLEIGFFYQQRKASPGGNDLSTSTDIYNVTATKDGSSRYDVKSYNMFVKKKNGPFTVAIEAGMQDGSTGLYASGTGIDIDAYAIAGEIGYKKEGSKWDFDLKLGTITGDDKNTTNKYEGYLVDRNYDVAMLMFNYVLGDGSRLIGNENYVDAITNSHTKVDVGQISNTLYFAPGFHRAWNDKWGMKGRFIYAQLGKEQQSGQSKDLGYEFDFSIYYRPLDRFVVQMDTAYLFAGDAFAGGTLNKENDNAYGIITKAAISF